ncbi:MAG TPA: hypothetical protein VFL84_08770 [Gammaproteobacteria bacterium]|nr:hypothetical protein [Gammaproteobacteria bacterium]
MLAKFDEARRPATVAAIYLSMLLAAASPRLVLAQPAPQSAPANAVLPRLPDGHPDLQGLWLKTAGGFQGLLIGSLDGTNFAGGGGRGGARRAAAGPPPGPRFEYTPEAAAEKLDREHRGYDDPEAHCHLPGVPRALDQPGGLYPVQIIQDENYIALLHEAMHDVRIIPTDDSPHPKNYWAWDGDSRGRWEGDVFVVDVSDFNGRTWLDMAGDFVDENEHVLERFTLLDHDTILYEATVTDPTVFVKPAEFRFTLKRLPADQQILEYSCLEGERSLQHYTKEDGGKKRRVE